MGEEGFIVCLGRPKSAAGASIGGRRKRAEAVNGTRRMVLGLEERRRR